VGDSPIVGCGTWCDKTVAVSCTGVGEEFIRINAAHRLAMAMEFKNMNVAEAAGEPFRVSKPGALKTFITLQRVSDGSTTTRRRRPHCSIKGWINGPTIQHYGDVERMGNQRGSR
jgi:hypothetical protein